MAFKMKGPSLYPNFRGKKEKMIVINHEGPAGAADGRASSSPFQRKTDGKTKEQLLKEGFTPRDADQMIKDGATTGRQKTKAKPKSQQDFEPAYPGADISKAEYDKAKKAGVKSEAEYAEYKAKMKKKKSPGKMKHGKSPMKGYKSAAQRKAVHASKADGGAGNPNKKKKK
tara:strand:+ start:350 stop:862 length:513 start_codon:yes stop_codon:yes gene_type:complete